MKLRLLAFIVVIILFARYSFSGCAQDASRSKSAPGINESTASIWGSEYDARITPRMWKVTDAEGHLVYLFGSVQMADNSLFHMPKYFEDAYKNSEYVAFEINSGFVFPNEIIYTDGSTVGDHVDREAYSFAKNLLVENGGFTENLDRMKPVAWLSQLNRIVKNRDGYLYNFDEAIRHRAQTDLKQVIALETVKTHANYMVSQPEELQEWLFSRFAHDDYYHDSQKYQNVYEKWKEGTITFEDEMPPVKDLTSLQAAELSEQERKDYQIYQKYFQLYTEANTIRNHEMTETILQTMRANKRLLVVADVLLFLCENNICELLEKEGCTVSVYPSSTTSNI